MHREALLLLLRPISALLLLVSLTTSLKAAPAEVTTGHGFLGITNPAVGRILLPPPTPDPKDLKPGVVVIRYSGAFNVAKILSESIPGADLKNFVVNEAINSIEIRATASVEMRARSLIRVLDVSTDNYLVECRVVSFETEDLNQALSVNGVSAKWSALFDKMETKQKSETLARPTLLTLLGKKSHLEIKTNLDNGKNFEQAIFLGITPRIGTRGSQVLDVSLKQSVLREYFKGSPTTITSNVKSTISLTPNEDMILRGLITPTSKEVAVVLRPRLLLQRRNDEK